jgi:hypothetical protein
MDQQPTGAPVTPTPPTTGWSAPPPPAPPAGRGFDFNDFISFRYLITPTFITVIYVIGAVLITLGSLASLTQGAGGIISGVILFLVGNLLWRIYTEFVMVLFRINDSLQSIDRRGRGM